MSTSAPRARNPRPLVFVPTYNERNNVESLCAEILALSVTVDILFLDDGSPDGTGEILDRLAAAHANIHVIHRGGKSGIGSAHLAGIRWAYEKNYATLITMDADHTHPPRYIPDFIAAARDSQVVVGSRHLRQDSLDDWHPVRLFLTRLSHILTRSLLKMPYDATGAYRLYKIDSIPLDVFGFDFRQSYSFFFESLYVLMCNSISIKEIPITLPARTIGQSKMTFREALGSTARLLYLYILRITRSPRLIRASPRIEPNKDLAGKTGEWDDYWQKKKRSSGHIFDAIAAFYRVCIIKRTLNHFVRNTFPPRAKLLHAGCGSGQVDVDVTRMAEVTAMDVSLPALRLHHQANAGRASLRHGDIFAIPFEPVSFDGVYNLGVMEHFTPEQIHAILLQFHRALKPGGKLLLFWPPTFGVTVMVLDAAHFILNRVLRRNVKLHPDEITRIRSREQIEGLLTAAGFKLNTFYFGPMDLFTHAIIVATKANS